MDMRYKAKCGTTNADVPQCMEEYGMMEKYESSERDD